MAQHRLLTIFWADGAADRLEGALTLEIPLTKTGEPRYHDSQGYLTVTDLNGTTFRFERGPMLYTLQSDLTQDEYDDWKKQVEARQRG